MASFAPPCCFLELVDVVGGEVVLVEVCPGLQRPEGGELYDNCSSDGSAISGIHFYRIQYVFAP